MRNVAVFPFALLSLCLSGFLFGCGSSGDDDDEEAIVDEMYFDETAIERGEGVVLNVKFQFSQERVFQDGDEVVILLELPTSLLYRRGSAEVQKPLGDEGIGINEIVCPSGLTYLEIELDDDDLTGAGNPSGDADGYVTLTLDAVATDPRAVVFGKANYNSVFFTCTDGLLNADTSAAVAVIR